MKDRVIDGQVVPELRLTVAQIDAMEQKALENNDVQAYLLVGLCARRSWRISSLTGYERDTTRIRRVKDRYVQQEDGTFKPLMETVNTHYALPGIRREDVGEENVAVHFKGDKKEPIKVRWEYVPEPYMSKLKELRNRASFGDRLFPWTERKANRILVDWARAAGIPNAERIHVHRLRHHFGTHMGEQVKDSELQKLMGHKTITSTMIYRGELSPEKEREILQNSVKQKPQA